MPTLRRATLADAALITQQRNAMFADNGFGTPEGRTTMDLRFREWIERHLAAGTYVGLFLEDDTTHEVLAAAGVYFMDWPPHYLDPEPVRAYLLNFYTAPEARGHGYASQLLEAAVAEARTRSAVVTLHASPMGKRIYEKFGFSHSNEWMLKPTP